MTLWLGNCGWPIIAGAYDILLLLLSSSAPFGACSLIGSRGEGVRRGTGGLRDDEGRCLKPDGSEKSMLGDDCLLPNCTESRTASARSLLT